MVTDEVFVVAWQGCGSLAAVAKRLGIGTQNAAVRASRLRKRGVPLKKYPGGGGRNRKDVTGLATLARKHAGRKTA